MTGAVVGGWEFVVAAYTVTFLALCVYSCSILRRYGRERRRASRGRPS